MLFYPGVVIASVAVSILTCVMARRWQDRPSTASRFQTAAIVVASFALSFGFAYGALVLEVVEPWDQSRGRLIGWSFSPTLRALLICCIPIAAGAVVGLLCLIRPTAEAASVDAVGRMSRRRFYKTVSRAIGWTSALIVAVPCVIYILRPLRRRASAGAIVQRLAQLENLPVEQPVQMAVWGTRQDAWTRYPRQVIGRVWLIRKSDESTPPAEAKIDAFSAVCPHLGCSIQRDADAKHFMCPCHNAFFKMSGEKVDNKELGYINPTPRGMDKLACRVVQDEAAGGWWVEVEYEKFEHGLTTQVPKS